MTAEDTINMHSVLKKSEEDESLVVMVDETEDNLVVFFFEADDRDADEIIEGFETIDDDLEKKGFAMVKTSDEGVETNYGIIGLPKIVYFQHGIPIIGEIDLMDENAILAWIDKQSSSNSIHQVSDVVLEGLINKFDHIAVLFYSHKNMTVVRNLESIADDCADNDIAIVKLDDKEEAAKHGLKDIPALMFFNFKVPSTVSPVLLMIWALIRESACPVLA